MAVLGATIAPVSVERDGLRWTVRAETVIARRGGIDLRWTVEARNAGTQPRRLGCVGVSVEDTSGLSARDPEKGCLRGTPRELAPQAAWSAELALEGHAVHMGEKSHLRLQAQLGDVAPFDRLPLAEADLAVDGSNQVTVTLKPPHDLPTAPTPFSSDEMMRLRKLPFKLLVPGYVPAGTTRSILHVSDDNSEAFVEYFTPDGCFTVRATTVGRTYEPGGPPGAEVNHPKLGKIVLHGQRHFEYSGFFTVGGKASYNLIGRDPTTPQACQASLSMELAKKIALSLHFSDTERAH